MKNYRKLENNVKRKGNNMIQKIKQYREYRRNKQIAKKELAKLAATSLPLVNQMNSKGANIIKFIIKTAESCKEVSGDALIQMILTELSDVLKTDNERLIDVLTYMAGLSQEDIQKILVQGIIETNPKNNDI